MAKKEKPIIFNSDMVHALLEDRKTMTRRVIKNLVLTYGITDDRIEVYHKEGYNGKINSKTDTSIAQRQLQGWQRWENLLKDKIQRIWEKGFRGLALITWTQNKKGLFKCFLIPQQCQNNQICTSFSLHGFSWDAKKRYNASKALRRKPTQQQAGKFEMGNSIRKLDGQTKAQQRKSKFFLSKFKNYKRGKKSYTVDCEKQNSKQKTYSKNVEYVPAFHIRNLPWVIGQKLWVRETWADMIIVSSTDKKQIGKPSPAYKASEPEGLYMKWKSPVFMPRKFSRITLEITDVRVERLQEITANDCEAEGTIKEKCVASATLRDFFRDLWNSIHKKEYRWEDNSWVWCISFRRVSQ